MIPKAERFLNAFYSHQKLVTLNFWCGVVSVQLNTSLPFKFKGIMFRAVVLVLGRVHFDDLECTLNKTCNDMIARTVKHPSCLEGNFLTT